jgi:hypothetical protein
MSGQSFGVAQEGYPALSTTQRYDNVSLGEAAIDRQDTNPSWLPLAIGGTFTQVGDVADFRPLVAVNRNGSTNMTTAETAALAPGNGMRAEIPVIGAVNFLRGKYLDRKGIAAEPSRLFCANTAARTGETIETLTYGHVDNFWQRMVDLVRQGKATADAKGLTYGLSAILWLQGQSNYSGSSRASYLSKLRTYRNDVNARLAAELGGQARTPWFFLDQTSGKYTRDTQDMGVGMAQLDFALEQPDCFLVGPDYPYTDKGGHLDANGYRWHGQMFGKVMHRTMVLGQGWAPLYALGATWRDREIVVNFNVPAPPLNFASVLDGNTWTDYPTKGFSAVDASGALTITAVEIVADTVVRLIVDRRPTSGVRVRYARLDTSNGHGNLRDSDATVASEVYEFIADSGMYASANIPELVGKPYPLNNWCCAFAIDAAAA